MKQLNITSLIPACTFTQTESTLAKTGKNPMDNRRSYILAISSHKFTAKIFHDRTNTPCFVYYYCKRKRFAFRQIQRALNEHVCVRAKQDKSRLTLHVRDSTNQNSRRNESKTSFLIFRFRDIKGFYPPIFVQCTSAFSNRVLARHFLHCQHEIVLVCLLRSCCHHGHTRIQAQSYAGAS